MLDSSIATALLTYGPLGVFCILMLIGWIVPKPLVNNLVHKLEAENLALRAALRIEREHSDAGILAARTTNELLNALKDVIETNRPPPSSQNPKRHELTWDDISR
jgi:hypothetical protein